MIGYNKNIPPCVAASGCQGWDNYTNYWDLYQLEPNKNKDNKYNMSD